MVIKLTVYWRGETIFFHNKLKNVSYHLLFKLWYTLHIYIIANDIKLIKLLSSLKYKLTLEIILH